MYTRTVSFGDDIIDPRDIVERVEELEGLIAEAEDKGDVHEEQIELVQWRDLLDEISEDEPLILDSYFEEYARQLAEDVYAMPDHWPFTCIDWEQAAKDLQMDYSTIEVEGYTYWQRS